VRQCGVIRKWGKGLLLDHLVVKARVVSKLITTLESADGREAVIFGVLFLEGFHAMIHHITSQLVISTGRFKM